MASSRRSEPRVRSDVEIAFTAIEERDAYRIEADCAMRDYDALEVDAGIMREALVKIAEKRPNEKFDPWAVEVARTALADCRVDV